MLLATVEETIKGDGLKLKTSRVTQPLVEWGGEWLSGWDLLQGSAILTRALLEALAETEHVDVLALCEGAKLNAMLLEAVGTEASPNG